MKNPRVLSLLALLALCPFATLHAADTPTITISKSDKLSIAIGSIAGADSGQVVKILQNDLAMSGYFNFVPAASAGFVVGGSSNGGSLSGTVTDRGGKIVLSKTFNGSERGKVHEFADEIVETLTGSKGIANSKIAFVATRTGHKEIYVSDPDGTGVHQLTSDGNISVSPKLSPDGRKLVYTGYKSGYADVYEIDLGNGARSRIIKFPGTNSGAAYSPDGRSLAVTLSKDGNPESFIPATIGAPRSSTGSRRAAAPAGRSAPATATTPNQIGPPTGRRWPSPCATGAAFPCASWISEMAIAAPWLPAKGPRGGPIHAISSTPAGRRSFSLTLKPARRQLS
jgi:TolB protein